MQLPYLEIDTEKIYKNTKEVVDRCKEDNIDVTAVTKCVGGNIKVAEAFKDGGAKALGDSRIDNLKTLSPIDIEKWLIRIPMISEAENVVKYSNLSLNSEFKTLHALNEKAKEQKKKHDVILMVDHGDLREGWFDLDDFYHDLKRLRHLDYLNIRGIGTNSNCAGAVIPEPESFRNFPKLLKMLEEVLQVKNPIVSGGNSGAYYMVENNTIPSFINNLRLGELLLFGQETSYQTRYDYLDQNIFKLYTEIIELKEKPSVPIGKHGKDAFGKEPVFEDKGIRKRAIVAIGKQDIPPEDLLPRDKDSQIVTASSDHLIVDITDSKKNYDIGDLFTFNCTYGSALRASTSDYVNKKFI